MFSYIKNLFTPMSHYFTEKKVLFKETVKKAVKKGIDAVPGGAIFLVVFTINVICLAVTAGILFQATVAGVAMSVSLAMLWIGAPDKFKQFCLRYSQTSTWLLDCFITVGLAVVGFSLGATLGTLCLFLGLNMSAMLAVVRYLGKKSCPIVVEPVMVLA